MPDVVIPGTRHNIPEYVAGGEESHRGAIILIHEVWGLNKNIQGLADRLASEGYLVVAPDLITHTGITEKINQTIMAEVANPETRDEAQKKMREAMAPVRAPEFGKETVEKLKDCFEYIKSEYKAGKVSVMGFCFGGTYSYILAASGLDIAAALPFYGQAPQDETELQKINCPVYAFYGEKDTRLTEALPQLVESMKKLGKDFKYKIYPDTGHAFMNDTNPHTYNEAAAKDAWKEALGFLSEHMK